MRDVGCAMRILVDADACPVKRIIVDLAIKHKILVRMYMDSSHLYDDGYSSVIICAKGRDAADYMLVNDIEKKDIVVTQDYGLAAMSLAKGAICLNQNGLIYSNSNIDLLLDSRYIGQKQRKHSNIKGPKKRIIENDEAFYNSLLKCILKLEGENNE